MEQLFLTNPSDYCIPISLKEHLKNVIELPYYHPSYQASIPLLETYYCSGVDDPSKPDMLEAFKSKRLKWETMPHPTSLVWKDYIQAIRSSQGKLFCHTTSTLLDEVFQTTDQLHSIHRELLDFFTSAEKLKVFLNIVDLGDDYYKAFHLFSLALHRMDCPNISKIKEQFRIWADQYLYTYKFLMNSLSNRLVYQFYSEENLKAVQTFFTTAIMNLGKPVIYPVRSFIPEASPSTQQYFTNLLQTLTYYNYIELDKVYIWNLIYSWGSDYIRNASDYYQLFLTGRHSLEKALKWFYKSKKELLDPYSLGERSAKSYLAELMNDPECDTKEMIAALNEHCCSLYNRGLYPTKTYQHLEEVI